jgi:hypothetical protein
LLFADGYSKEMDINPDLPMRYCRCRSNNENYPVRGGRRKFPVTEEKRSIYDEIHDALGQRFFAAHRTYLSK